MGWGREGGARKEVMTVLLKSASYHKHIFLGPLKFEIHLESVQKYIAFSTYKICQESNETDSKKFV